MHDWTRVPAGLYHAFHHRWIAALCDVLNGGLLPRDYYALAEQITGSSVRSPVIPDLLTLHGTTRDNGDSHAATSRGKRTGTLLKERPKTRFTAESESEAYRRKKSSVVVRHTTGDAVVALIEIVSPGNKDAEKPFSDFVSKVCSLLDARIHLLIVDPFPPGPRDPNGIHASIWEQVQGNSFQLPSSESRTLVAYECSIITRAYIEPIEVGDSVPAMRLFLRPGRHVSIPLGRTYSTSFRHLPEQVRRLLD